MFGRLAAGLLLAIAAAAPLHADVAPLTPEGQVMMGKQQALEDAARARFGDHGLIERLRDWRRTWGFILIGTEGPKSAPRLLIKDEYGWFVSSPGANRRVSPAVGHELNRLLTSAAVWREQPYNWGQRCRGAPRLFLIMHGGKETFGRLGCGTEGLAARAANIADTLTVPRARTPAILPARVDPAVRGVRTAEQVSNADIFERLSEQIASWERKTLAGFVEPYAEDALLEGPDGTFRGRKAVVDWARHLQDWAGPYSAEGRRVLHVANSVAQSSDQLRYTTHEVRWQQDGRPVRQTYSTLWRKNGGLWQIAHERISAVKPVTDRRPF